MDPQEEEKPKQDEKDHGITPEEMRLMRRKVLRFDKIKAQFDKMKGEFDKMKISYDSLSSEHRKLKEEYDTATEENVGIGRRTSEQRRRHEQTVESMEQKIKQLQLIVDLTTKSEEKLKREDERLRECLRIEKQLGGKLKEELEELRSGAADTFQLKQEMNKLTLENKSLKEAKEKYPLALEKCEQQESVIASLKNNTLANEQEMRELRSICNGLQKRVTALLEEKKESDRRLQKERSEKEELQGRVEAAENALVDESTQMDLQRNKYQNDIRTLKAELQTAHLKMIQLSKPTAKQPRVKWTDLSKDDLFNLIEELEMKNGSLQINLTAVAESSHQRELKIKEQGETIMALTSHILKAHPSLQESEQLQFIEKEIKEELKRKQWAQVVEKVMIENFRLKEAVTALGREYNASLRGSVKQ